MFTRHIGKLAARAGLGFAGLALMVIGILGGLIAVVLTLQTAWGWIFLIGPAALVWAIVLARVGARLLTQALDG